MRLRTLALLSALVVGSPLAAAVVDPAPLFAKGKEPVEDPIEKDFGVNYNTDDAVKRAAAVDSLSRAPDPLKFKLITTRVFPKERKDNRHDVLARGVEVLSRIKDPATQELIAKAARAGNAEERVLLIEAMARMPESNVVHKTLLDLLKDKETYVRAMSCYSLGEHRSMDALPPLLAALEDGQWQVRAASLSAMTRLSDKELLKTQAVPKLADFLENAAGRERDDCADAMRRITGKNLGKDVAVWRKWIAEGDAGLPKSDEGGGTTKPDGAYANQVEKPHFYGIDVVSHRAVIILDISLSMNEVIEIDKERLRRETSRRRAVTGEGAPKPGDKPAEDDDKGYDIPWWRIKTRLDLARYQAINLVSKLEQEQNFEIITFSTEVHPWMGKLVPATQSNKMKAIAMIEAIKPEDQTNTWGALAAAFEMSERDAKGTGLGPDEIFLVTDGAPSCGDIKEPEQILQAAVQICKMMQCRVNVIGIGIDLSFLRRLATSTGGQAKMFK